MPNRMVRDGFVDSERVNNLDYDEECFYHRLILKSDDAGRFDCRLDFLRSQLFPLGYKTHSDPVARGMDGCAREGLIVVYEVAGKKYVQITNWRKCGAAKISRWPAPDGTYDIHFVMMDTPQGMKLFVDTSIRSADLTRCTPFIDSTQDEDEDEDGKSRPGSDRVGMGSTTNLPLEAKIYKKHPVLEQLHECIFLRGISLEQYLRAKQARSPYMDFKKASDEVVRRAELEGFVKKPAIFLDNQWSYWEKDNAEIIGRRAKKGAKVLQSINDMADAVFELKRTPGDESKERLARMSGDFIEEFGEKAHQKAVDMATKKLEGCSAS